MKSNAKKGSFAFVQNTDDSMCHISFNVEGGMNIQIDMNQVPDMIQALTRVLAADRTRIISEQSTLLIPEN